MTIVARVGCRRGVLDNRRSATRLSGIIKLITAVNLQWNRLRRRQQSIPHSGREICAKPSKASIGRPSKHKLPVRCHILTVFTSNMDVVGYLLDSGNRSGIGLVGRSAWTAADAHVRLLAGRPGAGGGRGRPLRMTPQNTGYLSQVDTPTWTFGRCTAAYCPGFGQGKRDHYN